MDPCHRCKKQGGDRSTLIVRRLMEFYLHHGTPQDVAFYGAAMMSLVRTAAFCAEGEKTGQRSTQRSTQGSTQRSTQGSAQR